MFGGCSKASRRSGIRPIPLKAGTSPVREAGPAVPDTTYVTGQPVAAQFLSRQDRSSRLSTCTTSLLRGKRRCTQCQASPVWTDAAWYALPDRIDECRQRCTSCLEESEQLVYGVTRRFRLSEHVPPHEDSSCPTGDPALVHCGLPSVSPSLPVARLRHQPIVSGLVLSTILVLSLGHLLLIRLTSLSRLCGQRFHWSLVGRHCYFFRSFQPLGRGGLMGFSGCPCWTGRNGGGGTRFLSDSLGCLAIPTPYRPWASQPPSHRTRPTAQRTKVIAD